MRVAGRRGARAEALRGRAGEGAGGARRGRSRLTPFGRRSRLGGEEEKTFEPEGEDTPERPAAPAQAAPGKLSKREQYRLAVLQEPSPSRGGPLSLSLWRARISP